MARPVTAAQLEDPEGHALVAAIHERKAASHCRCWTEPARAHTGHCCMETAGQTCHETTGQTAHQEGTR